MKRSTKLALSLVLAAVTVVPALAQDNFPDVPANHWAYEALARLKKEGLLVGYPDGLFRGPRPASRYELAVAIHAAYLNLHNLIDGLQSQVDALKSVDYKTDIQNLKDQVANLQSQIDAMKGYGDDIAALKKATDTFDKELRSLGVDVEAMKKDIGDIADRVTRLEKRKPAVDISGDLNFLAIGGASSDGNANVNKDGRVTPTGTGLTRDAEFFHEGAFHVAGTNDTGPKWQGTFVIGNMLNYTGLGSQSVNFGSSAGQTYTEGSDSIYIQDLSAKFDTSIVGLAFNAEAGRVGLKLNEYVYQRPDPSSYYSNARWSNGEYHFDGAILGFNFGSAKVKVFAGNNSQEYDTNGFDINQLDINNNKFAGSFLPAGLGTGLSGVNSEVDRTLGANVNIGLGAHGQANAEYIILDSTSGDLFTADGLGGNRDNIYGGDLAFTFGRIKVSGAYHQSDLTQGNTTVNNSDNEAYNGKVSYGTEKWSVYGGYRVVENNYYAPGDWGRLGLLSNPANIEGFQYGGYINLSKALSLSASGEYDKGHEDNPNTPSPFNTSTRITNWKVRLDYKVNSALSVYGSWEDARFGNVVTGAGPFVVPDGGATDSVYQWTTFGIGYGLSANAKFNIQYEISDVDNNFVPIPGQTASGHFSGGFLSTQLSVKF
jgi:hypothetical protein